MFAEGRVETGGVQALMLPEGSALRTGEAVHVWRVSGSGVNKVEVKLGERDPRTGDSPVLSGLAAGDRVLRSPGSTLTDGQKVEFAKPALAAAAPSAASAAVAAPAASASRN